MPESDDYHILFQGAALADLRRDFEALSRAAPSEPGALASFLRSKVELLRSAGPENSEAQQLAEELERRLDELNGRHDPP